MSFHGGQLKQQIYYSFTLLISYMHFNPFKLADHLFKTASNFPNFDDPNAFFPNSTGPWPRLQKGRKIPGIYFGDKISAVELFQKAINHHMYPPALNKHIFNLL